MVLDLFAILNSSEETVENLEDNVGSVCMLINLTKTSDTVDRKILLKNANYTVYEVKLLVF